MDVNVLIRLLMIIVVIVVSAIVGFYRGRGIQMDDPISFGIGFSFFIILLLWSWRKEKAGFIKQCILAVPFGPLFFIVSRIIGFDIVLSIYAGIFIFLLLVIKTANWKQHFFITLITAGILTAFVAYLKHNEQNLYKGYTIFALAFPFVIFYAAYLGALGSQKTIQLRHLAVTSLMLSGALLLVVTLFLISYFSFRSHRFGFWITFMISVLLSLCLLGFCYHFKIGLSGGSVSNENSEITNKKFIGRLKKVFCVFRDKDEKADKVGKCALCERSIYNSGVSHVIKDHTICEQCYKKIQEEKTRIT
ncbi:MAG: hypothetical protein MUO22_00825 [Sedimentisphaerales bacterium]|nr:hypothetical protein [Sedimentisphaerales bacterium]